MKSIEAYEQTARDARPCAHEESTRHLARLEDDAEMIYLRCVSCGLWLSLGPANDSPIAVRIEIRAAELAVMPHNERVFGRSAVQGTAEAVGWHLHAYANESISSFGDPIELPASRWEWSGWLARDIACGEESYGECRAPVLGPANDRIPRAEHRLAELLAEIELLWEPGASRDEAVAIAVDDCATDWLFGEGRQ